jgi:hypothetical protein
MLLLGSRSQPKEDWRAKQVAVILLWSMSGPIVPQICFYWRVLVVGLFCWRQAGRTRNASAAQEGQAMSHKVDANKHAKQPEDSQGSEGSQGSGSNPLQQLEKEFAQLMQKQEQSQAAT